MGNRGHAEVNVTTQFAFRGAVFNSIVVLVNMLFHKALL